MYSSDFDNLYVSLAFQEICILTENIADSKFHGNTSGNNSIGRTNKKPSYKKMSKRI